MIFHLRVIEDSYGPMRLMVQQSQGQNGRANSEDEDDYDEEAEQQRRLMAAEEEESEKDSEGEGDNLIAFNSVVNAINSPIDTFDQVRNMNKLREEKEENSNIIFNDDPNLNLENLNSARGDMSEVGGVVMKDGLCENFGSRMGHEEVAGGPILVNNSNQTVKGGVGRRMTKSEDVGCIVKPNSLFVSNGGGAMQQKGGVYSDEPRSVYNKLVKGPKSLKIPKKKSELVKHVNQTKKIKTFPSTTLRKHHQLLSCSNLCQSKATSSSTVSLHHRADGGGSSGSLIREDIGVKRSAPSKSRTGKIQSTSISSAGDILCCSSIKSGDIRYCNRNFLRNYKQEVASKNWKGAVELGVEVCSLGGENGQVRGNKGCSEEEKQRNQCMKIMIHSLWGHKDVGWVAKESEGLSGGMLVIWNSDTFNMAGKKKLWEDLVIFKQQSGGGEWCLGGDFNAVLHSSERKGISADSRHAERACFNRFVEEMEEIDVPILGKKFSWFSTDGDRDISDHCLVWLVSESKNWGPKPFKVINGWLEHPKFFSFVEKSRKGFKVSGKKAYVLKEKFRMLKECLRKWNREVFGILDLNIEKTVKDLNNIEGLMGDDEMDLELTRREGLNKEFWRQLHLKESLLKQKSRMRWVKEGDSNSRYFHESIKSIRRRNHLVALKDGEQRVQGVEEVKVFVKNFFDNNFRESLEDIPNLNGVQFQSLTDEDNLSLLDPFSIDEVKEAIWCSDGNKCPRPDGFNFNFFKTCWEIVKDDLMEFVFEFYNNASLSKAITSSFIALIPKKDHPQVLSDYRPICLVSSLYKILSKILAARLKKVLGKVISKVQSAFLPNRQILDGVLVVNELLDLAKRRKDKCLFFKVDFERAYDMVNWNFLDYMMGRMGFAEGWRKWIRAGVFQSSMSVLVNGSPTGDFKVDDTILVGEGDWDNLWTIKTVLRSFEIVSGLKVNFHKSKLYGINLDDGFLRASSAFLNCGVDSIPFRFLGIPVGENPRRKSTWAPILESMKKILSTWNGSLLSIGGTVTRIKEAPWSDLLKFQYGSFVANFLYGEKTEGLNRASIWWRDSWKLGGAEEGNWFGNNVCSMLGDGNDIAFWKEKWLGTTPLCDQFPTMFLKTMHPDGVISSMGFWERDKWIWKLEWTALLSDTEIEISQDILLMLEQVRPLKDSKDRRRWKPHFAGFFTVKTAYAALQRTTGASKFGVDMAKALKSLWSSNVPSKVSVFGWRLLLKRLPTREALYNKGVIANLNET
ncbi:hypothetical protein TSUD_218730 [Trifolium subterraneum]|uniref:Reverse transcriptase domain-containing protein n=1 Tax=Trifolium subterraneum TaxID=3900 RepID=A0A2Z6N5V0_TRISU|nr:hypothetical protein TSUD_218730 [Trifolium subterraneum]